MLFLAGLPFGIRHESHEAGEFDGGGEHALVLTAKLGVLVRLYLKLPRHKLTEYVRLLVVDMVYFVLTC